MLLLLRANRRRVMVFETRPAAAIERRPKTESEADMRHESERKDRELRKSPKVEFVSGGTQPGIVVPPSKFRMPIPVVPSSGLQSALSASDAASRDGRQNKKSKWMVMGEVQ